MKAPTSLVTVRASDASGVRLYLASALETLPTTAGELTPKEVVQRATTALANSPEANGRKWVSNSTLNYMLFRSRTLKPEAVDADLGPLAKELGVTAAALLEFVRSHYTPKLRVGSDRATWDQVADKAAKESGADVESTKSHLEQLALAGKDAFVADKGAMALARALPVRIEALFSFASVHAQGGPPSKDAFPELEPLEKFVGQEHIKDWVRGIAATLYTNDAFEELGVAPHTPNRNFVLMGDPGTGKTTMSVAIGHTFKALFPKSEEKAEATAGESEGAGPERGNTKAASADGDDEDEFLSKTRREDDATMLVNRTDLVAGYVGQSAQQTRAALRHARREELQMIVDEAYALNPKGSKSDFSPEVITELMQALEDDSDDLGIALLGYKKEMEELLASNPGFDRRIPAKHEMEVADAAQMAEIFDDVLKERGLNVGNVTRREVLQHLETQRAKGGFGGPGEIKNLLEDAIGRQRLRAYKMMREGVGLHPVAAAQLRLTDFLPEAKASRKAVDPFKGMIGLEEPKEVIDMWAAGVRGAKDRGENPLERAGNVFLFKGPPGTGKTTTANAIGAMAKDIGALPSDDVEVVHAGHLRGNGDKSSEELTRELLERCRGKTVLFEEAYALPRSVVDTFVAESETANVRGRMICIFNGYEDAMDDWLEENEGMFSRVPNQIDFRAFEGADAVERATDLLKPLEESVGVHPDVYEALPELMQELVDAPKWASARDVGRLVDKAVVRADYRVAKEGARATPGITVDDVEKALDAMRRNTRLRRTAAAQKGDGARGTSQGRRFVCA